MKFRSFILKENPEKSEIRGKSGLFRECVLAQYVILCFIRGSTKNYFKDRHVLGLNTATASSYAKRSVYEFYATLRI